MAKIRKVKREENPELLVITPLLPGHKISKDTKKTIKRNDIKFEWIASEGPNNIPTNVVLGLHEYSKEKKLPDYYIMLDNDVILGRHMLDRLHRALSNSDPFTALAYASFEFKGHVNRKFPAVAWNLDKLVQDNYISSNSMFKTNIVMEVGLVTDDKYKRLLDWAFLIKLASKGYYGINVPTANFTAVSTKTDISAGSTEDYQFKRRLVMEDFILPLVKKAREGR